jgi:hypothetical protein
MPQPASWKELEDSVDSLRLQSVRTIDALHGLEKFAGMLIKRTEVAAPMLERAAELVARPGHEEDWAGRNELSGLYNRLHPVVAEMRNLQGFCQTTSEAHDDKLAGLHDEAVALAAACRSAARNPEALPSPPGPAEAPAGLLDVVGSGGAPGIAVRPAQPGGMDAFYARKRRIEQAEGSAATLERLAVELSALDRRAQWRRGNWVLIGGILEDVAEAMGDHSGAAKIAWSISPTFALRQLEAVRRVAELATPFAAAAERGAATDAAVG